MEYAKCWLAYPTICSRSGTVLTVRNQVPGPVGASALQELRRGLDGLYQIPLTETSGAADIAIGVDSRLPEGAYHLQVGNGKAEIRGGDAAGALYGVFALLREAQTAWRPWEDLNLEQQKIPSNALRMLNHWDNLDGSIERGYSGGSLFFRDNQVLAGPRTRDYARLVASVGINGVVLNNVNVFGEAPKLISGAYYEPLRQIQDILAAWGIRMYLSVNFASPILLGGLDTANPREERVQQWWLRKADEVWANLPGLGGFLVKADSEGQPGPHTYRCTQAEGANVLADAAAPHGGQILWRCFVYNCRQDWRDRTTDRARACYDSFMPLDGQFRDNVTLQIKNGPMDFQVREPVSPLLGGLQHTRRMLEVQIAQEYTGQQRHVCYLIPWFREILDTDLMAREGDSRVSALISGDGQGMAAVANTGDDFNWTGHDLAAANLYGFGRLSYDTSLSAEEIAREWLRQTYGRVPEVEETLLEILMASWPAYEHYTAPLGIGWMVSPGNHYGPNVDGYEYSPWGTYHRADRDGLGVDRTAAGTGYCGQYASKLAARYEDRSTCPQELLLFFHHLPYPYVLPCGRTVIQYIYDTHFEGAEEAQRFLAQIESLEGKLPKDVYERMHARFVHQAEHAREWRDVINSHFLRLSGIPDAHGRRIYT